MQKECYGSFEAVCLPQDCSFYPECGLQWIAEIKKFLSLDEEIVTYTRARQFFKCPEEILDQLNCKKNHHGHRYYSIGAITLCAMDEYAHYRQDIYLPLGRLELELLYLRNASRFSQIERAAGFVAAVLAGLGGLAI